MNSLKTLCLALLIISLSSCYKEEMIFDTLPNQNLELPLLLQFDKKDCFFDAATNHLRYTIASESIPNFSPLVAFKESSSVFINGKPMANQQINHLGTIKVKQHYQVKIVSGGQTEELTLSFTTLPMVRLTTLNQVVDEPKRLAHLTLHYPAFDSAIVHSYIGIEYRGASSQKHPKKSYGFTFLQQKNSDVPIAQSMFGCEGKEDWILDAVYKDQIKFRNKVSFEIWEAMNPTKNAAIASNFVELYLNNDYQGLYCLNEKISPEHLNITDPETVLYKSIAWGGTTTFKVMDDDDPPLYSNVWDGWKQQYPDPDQRINWEPLHELRDWVLNASDAEFIANASDQVDLDNIIDYYLFIYITGAIDNHGKNVFWLKEANRPFCMIPWDVDASWGRDWDTSLAEPMRTRRNNLFLRLLALNPDNFVTRLKNRWRSLRGSSWSNAAMAALLDETMEELSSTDVIALDNARWSATTDLRAERAYIHSWMTEQYRLLDLHFDNL